MPTPHPTEAREIAQALFLQGLGPSLIHEELGKQGYRVPYPTIGKWIQRGGWNDRRTKTVAVLSARSQPALTSQVAKRSLNVRDALAGSLNKLAEKLDTSTPKNLKQALALQAQLEPAVRNADKVFGWSKEGSETTMTVSQIETTAPQVPALQDTSHINNYVQSVEVAANQASAETDTKKDALSGQPEAGGGVSGIDCWGKRLGEDFRLFICANNP